MKKSTTFNRNNDLPKDENHENNGTTACKTKEHIYVTAIALDFRYETSSRLYCDTKQWKSVFILTVLVCWCLKDLDFIARIERIAVQREIVTKDHLKTLFLNFCADIWKKRSFKRFKILYFTPVWDNYKSIVFFKYYALYCKHFLSRKCHCNITY